MHFWKSYKGSKLQPDFLYLDSEIAMIEVKNSDYSMLTVINTSNHDINVDIPQKYIEALNKTVFTENATEKTLHEFGGISIILG